MGQLARRTCEEEVEMEPKYTLQPDEWVVIESEPGAYHLAPTGFLRQPLRTDSQTVVLTNRNIILVSMGLMGNPKGARYFPLNQIKVADGHPRNCCDQQVRPKCLRNPFPERNRDLRISAQEGTERVVREHLEARGW